MPKPFRARVCVLSFATGERLHDVTGPEAQILCDSRYAARVDQAFGSYIAAVELLIPDEQLHEMLRGREKPKGRPKPNRNAESSTGDGGRGLGPLIGKHRVLHYGPGIRL